VRFVIRLSVCSKAALLQNKKVSGRTGSSRVEGNLLRFELLVSQSKCAGLLKFTICVHHHDQMKENVTGGTCDRCGGGRREYRVLVGETDRSLGRPRR